MAFISIFTFFLRTDMTVSSTVKITIKFFEDLTLIDELRAHELSSFE